MKKFSWYTTTFNIINRYTNTINYARYSDKVADGINKMWLEGFYKPNRKGGHTHNHIKNKFTSNDIRSKDFRHIIKRAEEMKWNSRKSEIKLMNHYKKMRKWIKVWRSK